MKFLLLRMKDTIKRRLMLLIKDARVLSKRDITRILVFAVFIGLAGGVISSHLVYTGTGSVRYRLFLKVKQPLAKGSYVMVSTDFFSKEQWKLLKQHGYRKKNVKYITKRIGCGPGDILDSRDGMYFCNGEYLGVAKKYSRKGILLERFKYSGKIPEGYYFLIGDYPDSYDSRYYGLVHRRNILSVLSPIL